MVMSGRHILFTAATVLGVAAIALYGYRHPHLFTPFADVSPGILLCLVATRILFHLTNGVILREIASRFAITLTVPEWFGLPFVLSLIHI